MLRLLKQGFVQVDLNSMVTKVKDILDSIRQEEEERLQSILVEKNIDLEFDLGNLFALDANPIEEDQLKYVPVLC